MTYLCSLQGVGSVRGIRSGFDTGLASLAPTQPAGAGRDFRWSRRFPLVELVETRARRSTRLVAFFFGVDAERKPLEAITDPISLIKKEEAAEAKER